MKKSILNLIEVLKQKLIEFPTLVDSLEKKDVLFLDKLFFWMKAIEAILATYNISEVSEIAGLRSKISAERFTDTNGASKKKIILKIATSVLYDLQKTTLDVLKPYELKADECRALIRQLLLIISEMKVIHYNDEAPFENLIDTILQFIFSNDQLKAGGIKLKTSLPLNDIRVLIAEEISLEDFQKV